MKFTIIIGYILFIIISNATIDIRRLVSDESDSSETPICAPCATCAPCEIITTQTPTPPCATCDPCEIITTQLHVLHVLQCDPCPTCEIITTQTPTPPPSFQQREETVACMGGTICPGFDIVDGEQIIVTVTTTGDTDYIRFSKGKCSTETCSPMDFTLVNKDIDDTKIIQAGSFITIWGPIMEENTAQSGHSYIIDVTKSVGDGTTDTFEIICVNGAKC
eukprot:716954_1